MNHIDPGPALATEDCRGFEYTKAAAPAVFHDLLDIGGEQYCRYLWSKQARRAKGSAWQAIGRRRSGKPVATLLDYKLRSEGYIEVLGDKRCSVDVFLSPNQFFDWRNAKQLAMLHANWLEIDTAGHQVLTIQQQEALFADVLQVLAATGLPAPTGYVSSGSGGMHLYWIYRGVPAYRWRVRIWREVTLVLARTLKRARQPGALWAVDFAASRDPARVLRLPGTYHGKSGRLVHAFVGGPVYAFDALARPLITSRRNLQALALQSAEGPIALPVRPKLKPEAPASAAPHAAGSVSGRHTIGQWWFRIYSVVCSHARSHGVCEGRRDLYAFILYVALRHLKPSPRDALDAVLALNREFIHLDDEELRGYLKTATSKHYKYAKDTVAEYLEANLGISPQFLYERDKAPLPRHQVRERQQEAARQTANTRRHNTLEALQAAVGALLNKGLAVTQKSLAAASGRSERTVRRYWPQLDLGHRTLAPPVYIPAPGQLAAVDS